MFASLASEPAVESGVGEGEGTPQVEFTVLATQLDRSPIPQRGGVPTLRVGDTFLVQVWTKDLRSNPQGVAAAYFDLEYSSGLLRVDRRENQLISIDSAVTGGTFTLTVTNPVTSVTRTTGNIAFDLAKPATTRANIGMALTALDNVEPGELTVDAPFIFENLDSMTHFIVRFGGRYANRDIAEMTPNGDQLLGGQAPKIAVSQKSGVNPSNASDFLRAIQFGDTRSFRDVVSADDGETNMSNVIDDLGASEFTRLFGQDAQVVEFQATAISTGVLRLQTSRADILPAHPVLLHGIGSAIPEANVSYGGLSIALEPPAAIVVTDSRVLERSDGAEVGTLSVANPEAGRAYTFSVDDPRFEVVDQRLKLKTDQFVIAETSATINVVVTATDDQSPPQTKTQSLVLSVAANPRPWQNSNLPADASGDGAVVPLDALAIINLLNNPTIQQPNGRLPESRAADSASPFYDVNGDNFATPQDALLVINQINSQLAREGESNPSELIFGAHGVEPGDSVSGDSVSGDSVSSSVPFAGRRRRGRTRPAMVRDHGHLGDDEGLRDYLSAFRLSPPF